MSKRIFVFFLLLIPLPFLKAQSENKVFEKVEVNAHTNKQQWIEHIARKTQLPDSILSNIPPGTYKVNIQFVVDIHGSIGQIKQRMILDMDWHKER